MFTSGSINIWISRDLLEKGGGHNWIYLCFAYWSIFKHFWLGYFFLQDNWFFVNHCGNFYAIANSSSLILWLSCYCMYSCSCVRLLTKRQRSKLRLYYRLNSNCSCQKSPIYTFPWTIWGALMNLYILIASPPHTVKL